LSDPASTAAALGAPPPVPRASRRGRGLALPLLVLALLALAPVAAAYGPQGYLLSLFQRVAIFGLAALSLDLILGCGGLVSFGHAAYLGIGAYAVGILAAYGVDDLFVQAGAALAASALFALATGAISLRTQGVYFIMITLAFGQMLYFVATALSGFGGDDGMTLPGRSRILGHAWLADERAFYALTVACLAGAWLLVRALAASRFGRVLRAAKENETRVRAIGFAPYPYRLAAYVISGMLASLAGVLAANQAGFVSPAFMAWQRSGDLIAMVVLGGVGSLGGALAGAAAILLAEEGLAELTENWRLIFGPLLVVAVLTLRGGLAGLMRREPRDD
jgi:branched-chain amino acid transport system permease protein